MTEEKNNEATENQFNYPKEKFREALEKKKKSGVIRNNNISGNSKIHGDQAGSGSPKMFRRKSGSA